MRQPSKGAFCDPSAWQQHKAAFGFGEFDDFQFDAVLSRGRSGFQSRITLVAVGQLLEQAREVREMLEAWIA